MNKKVYSNCNLRRGPNFQKNRWNFYAINDRLKKYYSQKLSRILRKYTTGFRSIFNRLSRKCKIEQRTFSLTQSLFLFYQCRIYWQDPLPNPKAASCIFIIMLFQNPLFDIWTIFPHEKNISFKIFLLSLHSTFLFK